MKDKNFTTFEEQVDILKRRGLIIGNEEAAINALKRYGYYNIINGYKDPFVDIPKGSDSEEKYKNGVTFEEIYALYLLDRNIRISVMDAILDVEDHLRTATAYVIAEAFTADQSKYLDRKNYRLGKIINDDGDYTIDAIFKKFKKILADDTQPVKHYREDYGNVPPWILLKEASFGNIVNFIKMQKGPQKREIVSLIYGYPVSLVSSNPDVFTMFMDTIFICLDYRNFSAHGGRIYNLSTNSKMRYNTILHGYMGISEPDYRLGKGITGLPVLCAALSMFEDRNIANRLKAEIKYYYDDYLEKYPNSKEYLDKYLIV